MQRFSVKNRIVTLLGYAQTLESFSNIISMDNEEISVIQDFKNNHILTFAVAVRCPADGDYCKNLDPVIARDKENRIVTSILQGRLEKGKYFRNRQNSDFVYELRSYGPFTESEIHDAEIRLMNAILKNPHSFFNFNFELPESGRKKKTKKSVVH